VLNVFCVHAASPLLYRVSIWRLPNTLGQCFVAAEHPLYASAVTKFCVNRLLNFVAGPVGRQTRILLPLFAVTACEIKKRLY
jgi:hypothetical protein